MTPDQPDYDPWEDQEMTEYIKRAQEELIPKLLESVMTISLAPTSGKHDIKYATELGLSILMDKPIITVIQPGVQISAALRRASFRVIEIDLGDAGASTIVADAINAVVTAIKEQESES